MEILRREVRVSKGIILAILESSSKRKLVLTESLAIELYSLIVECVKSLTFKDHYLIVGVNKLISTTLANKH